MIMYNPAAGLSPPSVNNTGPGPRQPMGLPPPPSGASPPQQPTQPLTAYQQQGNTGLPAPNQQGRAFLPKPLQPYDPTTALGY